jgi:hypothetical protein
MTSTTDREVKCVYLWVSASRINTQENQTMHHRYGHYHIIQIHPKNKY